MQKCKGDSFPAGSQVDFTLVSGKFAINVTVNNYMHT